MHGSGIPIWFFIGVMLLIYGVLIVGYGFFELATGCYPPAVELTSLHTPIWWGGILLITGLLYVVKFYPHKAVK
jgi:heme/copper-type cytochrome/quinol oxidase subunit 3